MRAAAVTIPNAINPSPTMEISTSIFSRVGICFEGFMVLRLLARHMVDLSSVGRREAGHTARSRDFYARLVAYRDWRARRALTSDVRSSEPNGLKSDIKSLTTPILGIGWSRRAERGALQLSCRTEVLPAAPDPLAALSTRSLVRPYSTRMPDGL
jgi:hypothetical protein